MNMLYVLTIIMGGTFSQTPVDHPTCRVYQAHNVAVGADIATCGWVRDVAA